MEDKQVADDKDNGETVEEPPVENGELEDADARTRRAALVALVAIVVVGAASAWYFDLHREWFSDEPEMQEATPDTASDMARDASRLDRVFSRLDALDGEMKAVRRALGDGAHASRLGGIETRLRQLEDAVEERSRALHGDVGAQAEAWLLAVRKYWSSPGGARFALTGLRVVAVLVEQTPRLRPALIDLRRLIADIEATDADVNHAMDETAAVIEWIDLRAQPAEVEAPETQAADEERSLLDAGLAWGANMLGKAFQVRRTDEAESKAWETVVVRRALVVAQAALLDRDVAAWAAAIRHAHAAARQLPGRELAGKLDALARMKLRVPARDLNAPLDKIIQALRAEGPR